MKPHTIEEIPELEAWFKSVTLPETLQIDKATCTPNLPKTVESLFEQAYICYDNPKMQGCILLLKRIKTILEK